MSGLTRRLVVFAAALAPLAARAQSWPSGPIRIVVPFPPGGSVDAVARLAQAGLSQRLGATIVIENRTGASGSTGSAAVAKAPPDGNTWLIVFDTHAVNPSLLPNLPFDSDKDLDPVSLVATAPYVVARHPSRPYGNLGELIRAAKEKPGSISYASVGSGSIGHLALELLGKQAGIDLIHVPYRGGGPSIQDVVAGHIQLTFEGISVLLPLIKSGQLRALAVTSAKRSPLLPDVPTMIESCFPDFSTSAWTGLLAPAGTSPELIARLNGAVNVALQSTEMKSALDRLAADPLGGPPQELTKTIESDIGKWAPIVKALNLQLD